MNISKDELRSKLEHGSVDCLFATGTAAAITYINEVSVDAENFRLNSDQNVLIQEIKANMEDYKFGRLSDPYDWNVIV